MYKNVIFAAENTPGDQNWGRHSKLLSHHSKFLATTLLVLMYYSRTTFWTVPPTSTSFFKILLSQFVLLSISDLGKK